MGRIEQLAEGVTLYLGDCREILPTLAAESIDFIFTDPPYGHNNNNGDLIARRPSKASSLYNKRRWQ